MDIFHFPRLNNTFLGLLRHGEKNFAGTKKKLLTQSRGWCINLHRAAEKSGRGAEALGWFIDK